MKNIVFASTIAGLISGLLSAIIVVIGRSIGLYGVLIPAGNLIIFSVGWIVLTIVFCIFFGLLYKAIYDLIPGMGIKKGFFSVCFFGPLKILLLAHILSLAGVQYLEVLLNGFLLELI